MSVLNITAIMKVCGNVALEVNVILFSEQSSICFGKYFVMREKRINFAVRNNKTNESCGLRIA